MRKAAFCAWLTVLALLCGCKGQGNPLTPKSSGRPYEVLVVDDADGVVAAALSASMEGLPQREPWFDVVTTDSLGFERNGRMMRNVVRVEINPTATARTIIRYERDVYAAPQVLVHVIAPSRQGLVAEMPAMAQRLLLLLDRVERSREVAYLEKHHAAGPSQTVRDMFGARMWMPADMKASMRTDSFLWVSNDAAEGMCNICIYRIASADPARFVAQRDSVMKRNVKGETDQMYMTTVEPSVHIRQQGDRQEWVVRGLWEMVGDAMGGPFVARVMAMPDGHAVVAEAFVYAPEGRKRNLLRRTEAALYTLDLQSIAN